MNSNNQQNYIVPGFRVGAVDAGIRAFFGKTPAPDLTLIVAEHPCTVSGVFTTNHVKAAPVILDQEYLAENTNGIRAVMVNTASANACTGEPGLKNARLTTEWAAQAIGCTPGDVLVMSTGVIGTQLPMEKFKAGIPAVCAALRPDAWPEAAQAIMTTDTKPKLAAAEANGCKIVGIAKGAGMIAPNMATMLSVIVTDVRISPGLLHKALTFANERTFNRVVIDGDMSTNDTVIVLANGASGVEITETTFQAFADQLTQVCKDLAWKIVADGEGATRQIVLQIVGARTWAEARQIGNTIATSPLVKTAFYGGDANWGRILAAAGRAGVPIDQNKISLWYDDLQLVANGTPLNYDEQRANAIAGKKDEKILVRLDLGLGEYRAEIWTCDLSHDYVSINGHYRT